MVKDQKNIERKKSLAEILNVDQQKVAPPILKKKDDKK